MLVRVPLDSFLDLYLLFLHSFHIAIFHWKFQIYLPKNPLIPKWRMVITSDTRLKENGKYTKI